MSACQSGDPTTRVDELRVMAIQSDPAEIGAEFAVPGGESPNVNIIVADPNQQGGTFAVWTCTNFGEGCLEQSLFADNPEQWIQTHKVEDLLNQVPVGIHPGIWGVVNELDDSEQPFGATFIWVLACVAEACPALDSAFSGSYDTDFFADPFSMMSNLPIFGTSLAFRPLLLSTRSPDQRVTNPTLSPKFDSLPVIDGEESILLDFDFDLQNEPNDDSFVYAFTTIGGFASNDRLNSLLTEKSGVLQVEWFPPEEGSGTADLFVIVENGNGGSAIWTGEGEVK